MHGGEPTVTFDLAPTHEELARLPAAKALHGLAIESAYINLFRAARVSVLLVQAYFGNLRLHEAMLEALHRRQRGEPVLRLKLILDQPQMRGPICGLQPRVVRELFDHKDQVEIRLFRAPTGGFGMLHEKTMIVDDSVYLVGSANMTENSLTRNTEANVMIRLAEVVADAVRHFHTVWEAARPLEEADIAASEAYVAKRQAGRGPTTSGPHAPQEALQD